MSEVIIKVKTNKIGSEVGAGTGYTPDEWEELADDDKRDIISEIVWELVWKLIECREVVE